MNHASYEFHKPNNASLFEDMCLALFKSIWDNFAAQKNGRNGQSQAGVDIFGEDLATKSGLWGIQCKVKISNHNSKLSRQEVDEEIAKAERFKPRLAHWAIATTAARDGRLQEYVRQLCDDRGKNGQFLIHILAWEEIEGMLATNLAVAQRFYPARFNNVPPPKPNFVQATNDWEAFVYRLDPQVPIEVYNPVDQSAPGCLKNPKGLALWRSYNPHRRLAIWTKHYQINEDDPRSCNRVFATWEHTLLLRLNDKHKRVNSCQKIAQFVLTATPFRPETTPEHGHVTSAFTLETVDAGPDISIWKKMRPCVDGREQPCFLFHSTNVLFLLRFILITLKEHHEKGFVHGDLHWGNIALPAYASKELDKQGDLGQLRVTPRWEGITLIDWDAGLSDATRPDVLPFLNPWEGIDVHVPGPYPPTRTSNHLRLRLATLEALARIETDQIHDASFWSRQENANALHALQKLDWREDLYALGHCLQQEITEAKQRGLFNNPDNNPVVSALNSFVIGFAEKLMAWGDASQLADISTGDLIRGGSESPAQYHARLSGMLRRVEQLPQPKRPHDEYLKEISGLLSITQKTGDYHLVFRRSDHDHTYQQRQFVAANHEDAKQGGNDQFLRQEANCPENGAAVHDSVPTDQMDETNSSLQVACSPADVEQEIIRTHSMLDALLTGTWDTVKAGLPAACIEIEATVTGVENLLFCKPPPNGQVAGFYFAAKGKIAALKEELATIKHLFGIALSAEMDNDVILPNVPAWHRGIVAARDIWNLQQDKATTGRYESDLDYHRKYRQQNRIFPERDANLSGFLNNARSRLKQIFTTLMFGNIMGSRVDRLRIAAENGDDTAPIKLARIYSNGSGWEDESEAISWYVLAADMGDAEAQCVLATRYLGNSASTLNWYFKAAEQGNSTAQYELGNLYRFGNRVAQNDNSAINWYRKAAAQGNLNAQDLLSEFYQCEGFIPPQQNWRTKLFAMVQECKHGTIAFLSRLSLRIVIYTILYFLLFPIVSLTFFTIIFLPLSEGTGVLLEFFFSNRRYRGWDFCVAALMGYTLMCALGWGDSV